jgi:hypothetical protein
MCTWRSALAVVVSTIVTCGGSLAASPPTPTLHGPLADTATKGVLVWDMAQAGYVAEEFLVVGTADVHQPVAMADAANMLTRDNVADMAQRDFSLKALKKDQPYTTRIVVYRPADAKKFSGNVVFETLHPSGGGRSIVWDMLNAYFVRRGDAYIGVQHPSTFGVLKAANAERYGALAVVDNTQLWGAIAQVGALVKSNAATSPLKGYAVKYLFLTGYSFTGAATTTFANWYHDRSTLSDGRPVFDGYVSNANSMYNRPLAVPVMRMNTQGDFDSFGGVNNRRYDSDEQGSQYRLYELTGAAHVTRPVPPAPGAKPPRPPTGGATSTNQPRFSAESCASKFPSNSEPNQFPVHLFIEAMFDNMYRWVADGTKPPSGRRISKNVDGITVKDSDGNAVGGIRLPMLEIPSATYDVGVGDECFLFGYQAPFPAARLNSLYGAWDVYIDALRISSERKVKEGWLRPDAVTEIVDTARKTVRF